MPDFKRIKKDFVSVSVDRMGPWLCSSMARSLMPCSHVVKRVVAGDDHCWLVLGRIACEEFMGRM